MAAAQGEPDVASAVMSEGHWMVGGVAAATVTLKLHVVVFPQLSVAVATTVVVPAGNTDPGGGVAVKLAIPLGLDADTM